MAAEIIGEVLISALEYIGTDGGDSKDKKGCGCMIVIILLLIIGGWLYYDMTYTNHEPLKGIINNKLPNNKVLVKTVNGEDVYVITNELYLNKKCGDSITIIND